MKVFLTGATGYIGSAVAEALLAAGHSVAGLARSQEAEQKIRSAGMTPVWADLKSPESLTAHARTVEAVIHAGTTNDGRADADAVHALMAGLTGTGGCFIYTSGIWVLGNTGDVAADESAPLQPPPIVAWRPGLDQAVLNAAGPGLRTIVIRPAIVYGRGQGLPGMFVQSAIESGAARYIGDGENRWPMVHVEDLAALYVRALEKAEPGSLFHGVDGPSFRTREIAEGASFGADAGGRTESWPVEDAKKVLGSYLVDALLLDQVVSGEKAKNLLGWNPGELSVLEDLRYGSYTTRRINP